MTQFLDLVLKEIRKDRPRVPDTLKYTIRTTKEPNRTFASLFFRTRGCRYNIIGGCTMCDYWISDPLTSDQIVANVEEALENLDFVPDEVLVNVSGSFFDDLEVPKDARKKIYSLCSKLVNTTFIFETHSETITDGKIAECISYLGEGKVRIEMGLESSNPWILKYCVNKHLKLAHVKTALQKLRKYNIPSVINILIGIPFLSPSEIITDTVSSIQWTFDNGADRCVLFTMNMKPYTLTYWLEANNRYAIPPLWALIDVLSKIDQSFLTRTGIAWHRTRPQYHPLYTIENIGPTTCPQCYGQVMELIDNYISGDNRGETIGQLMAIKCGCRDLWKKKLQLITVPLRDRLVIDYKFIGEEILGSEWWAKHGASIISSISECDFGENYTG